MSICESSPLRIYCGHDINRSGSKLVAVPGTGALKVLFHKELGLLSCGHCGKPFQARMFFEPVESIPKQLYRHIMYDKKHVTFARPGTSWSKFISTVSRFVEQHPKNHLSLENLFQMVVAGKGPIPAIEGCAYSKGWECKICKVVSKNKRAFCTADDWSPMRAHLQIEHKVRVDDQRKEKHAIRLPAVQEIFNRIVQVDIATPEVNTSVSNADEVAREQQSCRGGNPTAMAHEPRTKNMTNQKKKDPPSSNSPSTSASSQRRTHETITQQRQLDIRPDGVGSISSPPTDRRVCSGISGITATTENGNIQENQESPSKALGSDGILQESPPHRVKEEMDTQQKPKGAKNVVTAPRREAFCNQASPRLRNTGCSGRQEDHHLGTQSANDVPSARANNMQGPCDINMAKRTAIVVEARRREPAAAITSNRKSTTWSPPPQHKKKATPEEHQGQNGGGLPVRTLPSSLDTVKTTTLLLKKKEPPRPGSLQPQQDVRTTRQRGMMMGALKNPPVQSKHGDASQQASTPSIRTSEQAQASMADLPHVTAVPIPVPPRVAAKRQWREDCQRETKRPRVHPTSWDLEPQAKLLLKMRVMRGEMLLQQRERIEAHLTAKSRALQNQKMQIETAQNLLSIHKARFQNRIKLQFYLRQLILMSRNSGFQVTNLDYSEQKR